MDQTNGGKDGAGINAARPLAATENGDAKDISGAIVAMPLTSAAR
jgi:hypothetical protein